jgi:protein-glucosylgalactosylhydroxylysine glucosidase
MLAGVPLSIVTIVAAFAAGLMAAQAPAVRIDRRGLVERHAPALLSFDTESPLSLGNGEFAFTVDATGLQTFPEVFRETIPLGTLSNWGWHTAPNPRGWTIDKYAFTEFDSHGRTVGYADIPGERTDDVHWLRANPHRLHLAQIGFHLTKRDGTPATPADLTNIEQRLDLWNGRIVSRFDFEGERVDVETAVHPQRDQVGVLVRSRLLGTRRLGIRVSFPYGTGQMSAADWTRPEAHATSVTRGLTRASVARTLDDFKYRVLVRWEPAGALRTPSRHELLIWPEGIGGFELLASFTEGETIVGSTSFDVLRADVSAHWNAFWSTGGVIDLSGSSDPRWRELQRRIVLSQYLTAIQGAGRYPPQESGLTFNSWEGKFHLEMHWWHAAHFALWDRLPLLEKSLGYYDAILDRAKGTARRQGYRGARWPKMTSPSGAESPSPVGPFLIWQQPHPIFYAELVYRQRRDRATLERFRNVIAETAEFMASFAAWDEQTSRYVLGPPLQCAQEEFPKDRTINCTFELAYWRWGLEAAQTWRTRLGLPREAAWDRVLRGLSPLPLEDGKYLFAESATGTYTGKKLWTKDHPAVTAAYGLLPPVRGVDRDTMGRTLDWIWDNWEWADTWGWDYPMVAMSAARLGDPDRAIAALLRDTPKNVYRRNGHNHQRPGLTIYLPGNGGLLYAVAMMAAGWDGAPDRHAPGFPAKGWVVRWEGLRRAP